MQSQERLSQEDRIMYKKSPEKFYEVRVAQSATLPLWIFA